MSEGVEAGGNTRVMPPSPLRSARSPSFRAFHTICCAAAKWGPDPVPHERCTAGFGNLDSPISKNRERFLRIAHA